MRFPKLILFLASSSLLVGAGPFIPIGLKSKINVADIIGPNDGLSNQTSLLTISGAFSTMNVNISYYTIKTGALVISENYNISDHLIGLNSFKLNYNFQLKNRLTENGLKIVIGLYNNGLIETSATANIYPKVNTEINGFDYSLMDYIISDRSFKIVDSNITYNKEVFSFKNTIDTLPYDNEYKIDLSQLSFTYSYPELITDFDSENVLRVYDSKNLFPSFFKGREGYFDIPIKLTTNGNELNFAFRDNMYHNPIKMDMSPIQKSGYKLVNNFYMSPVTYEQLDDGYFEFIIKNVSLNNLTIRLPMKIASLKNLFGYCFDSQYCIDGGIKE